MGWLDNPSFVSDLNAWIVVFGVEHEEYLAAVDLTTDVVTIPTWLASCFLLCDLPLLFVFSQVNNGVLYYLDYVEDIYIRVLFVLGSVLNPNHIVFTTSNKLYTKYNNKGLSVPVSILNLKSYVIYNTHIGLVLLYSSCGSSIGLASSSGARGKSHSNGKMRSLQYPTRSVTRRSAETTTASRSCHTRVRFFLKWLPGDSALTVRRRDCYRRSSAGFDRIARPRT